MLSKPLVYMFHCAELIKFEYAFVLLTVFILALTLSVTSFASDEFTENRQPGFTTYRNKDIATMSNEDLIEHALRSRESTLTREQIELNRQWANSLAHDDVIQGGKALSKFFKRGFSSYWREHKTSSKLPDASGRGKVNNSMDYDINLKSDEFRVGLSYEF